MLIRNEKIEDYRLFEEMIKYIDYYNKSRISVKLKGLSPIQYRRQSL